MMSTPSIASPARTEADVPRWYDAAILRIAALVLTFTAAATREVFHLTALTDSDIWLHLSTGSWILQHHAIPRTALFSQFAALPWVDSSWGFDLLTGICYRVFGLAGLPVVLMLLQVAIAIALFTLAGGRRNFWPGVILAALAQCSIATVSPRPAMCSLVLLACELTLLLHARRTGDTRPLLWLPLVFLIWTNLDRQFSYGLLTLVLFWIAIIVEKSGLFSFDDHQARISLRTLGIASAASLLATLISPYGYRSYLPIWLSATNSAADRFFRELHSLRFRRPQDYVLMLLVMAAFFALGRRRSRDLFLISLLIVTAIVSFRFQRDAWLVVVAAVAIIGNAITAGCPRSRAVRDLGGYDAGAPKPAGSVTQRGVIFDTPSSAATSVRAAEAPQKLRFQRLTTAAFVFVILFMLVMHLPARHDIRSGQVFVARISKAFPIGAADFIRVSQPPQPLFNAYAWGGFLTWALPEYPVLIDGRTDLYGDAINLPYFQAINAELPLQSYPAFTQAQTILLEANSPIAQALATLPNFRVAYRDHVAVVLVRTEHSSDQR